DSYLDIIEKSSHRMLKIINDLIDISKIEAGIIQLKFSEVFIYPLLNDVVYFFKPEAEKKGLKIELDCDEQSKNLTIISDQEKIYASLVNLIKNSIKYSNEGIIKVKAQVTDKFVEFSVSDNGIGIPEEKIGKIFDRFTQVESNSISRAEGAGLGLSIVKAYVDILGGTIKVLSQLGKGSKFIFTIPLVCDAGGKKEKILEYSDSVNNNNLLLNNKLFNPAKILVAEDEETNALYIKTVLKTSDYELIFAHDGMEAVEIFRKNPDIKIVLMDLRMPHMDGFEATKKIREIDENVVIIAQTAFAFTEDKITVLENGFNDYIPKPIRKDELTEIIRKHLSN
ncbi:MAG TPA: ATP-binding protein, partial [Bacteroidales bacterium]|nr:ATP-binding protein [Bacteroidales bacterium]